MGSKCDDSASTSSSCDVINVQVFAPDFNLQKCLQVQLDENVWDVKQKVLLSTPKLRDLQEGFNYGLFLPPCNGRAGKFLLEDRTFRDYPFQDCVPYLELKYKKRVYKMLNIDEKQLKQLHSKNNLKKLVDLVVQRDKPADKVKKILDQGLDPNFHDPQGETPLTLASSVADNRDIIMILVAGGAHLDFRNLEGQTPLHKAAFLASNANVKTLLELGASPNYKDPIGLSPLYYSMLQPESSGQAAELLLRDYAELGVSDPHGNQELHQACKNGLVHHVEHLLYYGADINSQNINGNTPLHVCAVNGRESCARVLLFRSADANIQNTQGQTAYHIAVIVGTRDHLAVADLIKNFDPSQAVPYRGAPRYNSKRKLNWSSRLSTLGRGRSFSSNSMNSVNSSLQESMYGMHRSVSRMSTISGEQLNPGVNAYESGPNSPAASTISSSSTVTGGMASRQQHPTVQSRLSIDPAEYRPTGTVRPIRKSSTTSGDFQAQAARQEQMYGQPPPRMESVYGNPRQEAMYGAMPAPNHHPSTILKTEDVNIPRILVIPRGPKGFGFILRGAKKMEPGVVFEPCSTTPALQFFEGVDMNGMAMKAGLRPGDFLLEINSVDVRCASHDQVVHLIQMSGEQISLKVITVDLNKPVASPSYYGTMPVRRAASAPRPPLRNPSTSLSLATGRPYSTGRYSTQQITLPVQAEEEQLYTPRHAPLTPSKSMESLPLPQGFRDPKEKVASVRTRSSNSRRISAAELEQLMARQPEQLEFPTSDASKSGPRHYNSVADMKRRKKQSLGTAIPVNPPGLPRTTFVDNQSPQSPITQNQHQPLKSFYSSPNLAQQQFNVVNADVHLSATPRGQPPGTPNDMSPGDDSVFQTPAGRSLRRVSIGNSDYSRPASRPKTPPPPPPPTTPGTVKKAAPIVGAPPPPAPPPPPELLRSGIAPPPLAQFREETGVTAAALSQVKLKSIRGNEVESSASKGRNPGAVNAGCNSEDSAIAGGITAEALCAVKLKPVSSTSSIQSTTPNNAQDLLKQGLQARRSNMNMNEKESSSSNDSHCPSSMDFDSDLKQALAKRRNKMTNNNNDPSASPAQQSDTPKPPGSVVFSVSSRPAPPPPSIPPGGRSGLSLKESVQQSVKTVRPNKLNNGNVKGGQQQHSPPLYNSLKDSGYTSSRNSLEPSECGDHVDVTEDIKGLDPIPPSPDFPPPPPPEVLNASMNGPVGQSETGARHRVSVLSQHLEDYGPGSTNRNIRSRTPPPPSRTPPPPPPSVAKPPLMSKSTPQLLEQDTLSVTSTLSTLSGCSESASDASRSSAARSSSAMSNRQDLHVPAPDYDQADSGTGDSESEDVTPNRSTINLVNTGAFQEKTLSCWSVGDVCEWLDSLYLSEYKRCFSRGRVDGRKLIEADRAAFTQLGVTRIAHRIQMEKSLKQLQPASSTAF